MTEMDDALGEFERATQEAWAAMDALWLTILDSMGWLDKVLTYLAHPTWWFKARRLRRAK